MMQVLSFAPLGFGWQPPPSEDPAADEAITRAVAAAIANTRFVVSSHPSSNERSLHRKHRHIGTSPPFVSRIQDVRPRIIRLRPRSGGAARSARICAGY